VHNLRPTINKSRESMVTIQLSNLIDFVADVFSHADSSPEEARRIRDNATTYLHLAERRAKGL